MRLHLPFVPRDSCQYLFAAFEILGNLILCSCSSGDFGNSFCIFFEGDGVNLKCPSKVVKMFIRDLDRILSYDFDSWGGGGLRRRKLSYLQLEPCCLQMSFFAYRSFRRSYAEKLQL